MAVVQEFSILFFNIKNYKKKSQENEVWRFTWYHDVIYEQSQLKFLWLVALSWDSWASVRKYLIKLCTFTTLLIKLSVKIFFVVLWLH